MATTITEEITALTTKIALLDLKIKELQHLSQVEEGGAGSKFNTSFTDINKLYVRRDTLNTRLSILERGQ